MGNATHLWNDINYAGPRAAPLSGGNARLATRDGRHVQPETGVSGNTVTNSTGETGKMTTAAVLLAYLAALPLVAGALLVVARAPERDLALTFMGLYGAAIIVFFGGVRWGIAVMRLDGPGLGHLAGAILPLIAAIPLFLPLPYSVKFPAIMALVLVLLMDDLRATRRGSGAPDWYLGVRLPLTVLIEIAFLVALAGL